MISEWSIVAVQKNNNEVSYSRPGLPVQGLWEGVQSVHRSGALRAMKGPHSLNHRRFILIFFSPFFGGYFQLFLVYFYMLSGHSAVQEINNLWKFTSGFLRPENLNFARNLVFSSFMTYHFICKMSNTTGATNGARTAYPWFLVALSLVFCVIFVVHCFSFCLFRFTASDYHFGFFKLFLKR